MLYRYTTLFIIFVIALAINPSLTQPVCAETLQKKLYPIVQNKKYGYIDNTGKIIIQPQFNAYNEFSEGLAVVQAGKVKTIERINFFGKVFEQYVGGYGYIDTKGKIVIEPKFDRAYNFREGLAAVEIDGKQGYIDKRGKIAIEPKFSQASTFNEGMAQIEIKGKCGYIDSTGEIVIPAKFDNCRKWNADFSEGLAPVTAVQNN